MSDQVIIKSGAEQDLTEIVQYYESKKEGLGLSFLNAVEKKLTILSIIHSITKYDINQFVFAFLSDFHLPSILLLKI